MISCYYSEFRTKYGYQDSKEEKTKQSDHWNVFIFFCSSNFFFSILPFLFLHFCIDEEFCLVSELRESRKSRIWFFNLPSFFSSSRIRWFQLHHHRRHRWKLRKEEGKNTFSFHLLNFFQREEFLPNFLMAIRTRASGKKRLKISFELLSTEPGREKHI